MMFVNLLGDKRMLINVKNITFVEETKDGCKIHFFGGHESIITGANYDELMTTLVEYNEGM